MLKLSNFVLFALMSTVLIGCGGSSAPPTTGSVSSSGSPVKKGSLAFHPDGSKGNNSTKVAGGDIVDGKYELYLEGKKGAPPGWYKVTVISTVPIDPKDEYSPTKSLINKKYNDPNTTDIIVEIKSKDNVIDISLKN